MKYIILIKKKIIIAPKKIIADEGPNFRYIFDLWELPNNWIEDDRYLYIFDCVEYFFKCLNSFLLKNKTMNLVISKIKIFINNNGPCKIIQTDHGLEFDNKEMIIFWENNKIQYITSSIKHPQTNGALDIIHRYECDYLLKRKKELKSKFNIEIAVDEFVIYHNNKKHTSTKYILNDIRHTEDNEIIKNVINNIIKALTYKIKKGDDIVKSCFVLLSTKIHKIGGIFKEINIKGKNNYRIPGIFVKFFNNTTAVIKVFINFKKLFKKNEEIKIDLKLVNWVDEFVYNFFMSKINNFAILDNNEII